MVSTAILLIVGGAVISSLLQMTRTQGTISNRTEMHATVRNATELLQQEIGQAGKISFPISAVQKKMTAPVVKTATSMNVNDSSGIFVGEQLVVDPGPWAETVMVTGGAGTTTLSTTPFGYDHTNAPNQAPLLVQGGFASGVIPRDGEFVNNVAVPAGQGSSPTLLKLYGEINDDGNVLLVEYNCAAGTTAAPGQLTRTVKTVFPNVVTISGPTVLLDNVLQNPADGNGNNVPCFTYQTKPVQVDFNDGTGPKMETFVLNVAVTLTVQTANVDQQTRQFQQESKALLNVAPRNVFEAWEQASLKNATRVQPTPPSIMTYLGL
jgi:hypothetical protein